MRAIPRQRAGACHWTLSRPAAALGGAAVGAVAMLLGATEGALAQEPRATAAEPAIVRLAAGWTPAEVLLRGAAFDAIRSIAVTDARGQDIAGTDVRIVQRGSDWIRIVVSVDDRALDRTSGFLTLVTEDARIASSIAA